MKLEETVGQKQRPPVSMTLTGIVPGIGNYRANAIPYTATVYTVPGSASELANHLLADTGISIVGEPTVNGVLTASSMFTDVKLDRYSDDYSIPDGILVTTGSGTPPIFNTRDEYSIENNTGGDTDVEKYAGVSGSQDAFSMEFDFTVPNGIPSVQFIFMFGSEEYPDYLDSEFVDGAAVIVDGVNYAEFANGTPLKVVSEASILNNVGLAIEYNGMSKPQKITALLDDNRTVHRLKIVIADTSDTQYDTGLFISAMKTSLSTTPGISDNMDSAPTGLTSSLDVNSITLSTAIVGGTVGGDGGDPITERGIVYSTSPNPMLYGDGVTKVADTVNEPGEYSLNLTGLTPGTTYYAKAFAKNAEGISYGNEITFVTKNGSVAAQSNEILTEQSLSNAEINLTLTDNTFVNELDKSKFILNAAPQGVSVKSVERVDDTHAIITLDYDGTDFDDSIDNFSITVDGTQLAVGGALTSTGGLTVTAVDETAPSGLSTSVSDISVKVTTVTVGGTILGDGGEAITERGIVYSTDAAPEIGKAGTTKVMDRDNSTGSFNLSVSGLIPSTQYHVRTYAINSLGITYGNEVVFATGNSTVTATSDREVSLNENNLDGAEITLTLTDNSFVNELDKNKFILNSAPEGVSIKSVKRVGSSGVVITLAYDGTDFDSSINNFSITVDASQMAYGGSITSGNLTVTAVVETSPVGVSTGDDVTEITTSSARLGGFIAEDGSEAITERGFVYSTTPNPALGNEGSVKVVKTGSDIGSYNIEITGLDSSTTYYVRAFATNILGTTYGDEVSFKTKEYVPSEPQPVVENITIDVKNGDSDSVVSNIIIKRTTYPDGTKRDVVDFTLEEAQDVVQKVKEAGNSTARIVIPDGMDEVSELTLNISKETLEVFYKSNINLVIDTENGKISIPSISMKDINDDVYFRLIPIKEDDERKEVENRAKSEQIVSEVAKDADVYVVGRPFTIETNMPSREMDITLPIREDLLPTDPTERADYLSKLVVYIEHDDGDKELVNGEIVQYDDTTLGIKFTIQKFSTFTILYMENWKEYYDSSKAERIAGKDRYETATAISKKGWATADTVVLARSDDFADALTGVPYAYLLNAPILMTDKSQLSEDVKAEILRLGAKKVVILGGTGAVSDNVKNTLVGLGLTVERIGGSDRYETAALIAAKLNPSGRDKAIVVSGENFADALAVASYAAVNGHPILLTKKDTLPEATKNSISSLGVSNIIIVGGEGRISNAVAAKLPVERRLSGDDRYATSLEVAKYFNIDTDQIALVTGNDFADGIAGSVLAAKQNNMMLLVKGNEGTSPYISSNLQDYINSINAQKLTIFGGIGAVNNEVMKAVKALIK